MDFIINMSKIWNKKEIKYKLNIIIKAFAFYRMVQINIVVY